MDQLFFRGKWVSEELVGLLHYETICVPFCRIEDIILQQEETLKLLSEQFETSFQNQDRSAKIRRPIDRKNQLLESKDAKYYIGADYTSQILPVNNYSSQTRYRL